MQEALRRLRLAWEMQGRYGGDMGRCRKRFAVSVLPAPDSPEMMMLWLHAWEV